MSPNITKGVTSRIRKLSDDLQKYAIITYPNDHPPAHIHFERDEKFAVIELVPEVRARQSKGFNDAELGEILELATYFRDFFLDKWDKLHRRRV